MAGFIFSLDNEDSLRECIENGVYSTNFKELTKKYWNTACEGTFADYISMKAGDNVYFFIKRKIYGIGRLVNIQGDCKYLNYPHADLPKMEDFGEIADSMLINQSINNVNNRCLCIFESHPFFFNQGIDMDDVLASNPHSFKMLRAFWKRSFIKIDDEENKALKGIILKRNEEFLDGAKGCYDSCLRLHQTIRDKVNEDYYISSRNLLNITADNHSIKHEMVIEAGIIDIITNNRDSIFGEWDYLSHQVIASPFKPIDYMDKMDVFGYRYIPNFDIVSKYLLIEIKKGLADIEAIDQLMKYVDWINQEYSFGDYSMIQAFLVAYDIPESVIEHRNNVCKRNYLKGRRPAVSAEWSYVKLIKYSFDDESKELSFEEIE